MKNPLHLIVRYKEISVTTIFTEPVVTEEWVIFNYFKFKILRPKKIKCDHSNYLGLR